MTWQIKAFKVSYRFHFQCNDFIKPDDLRRKTMEQKKKHLLNKIFSIILIGVLLLTSTPFIYSADSPVYSNDTYSPIYSNDAIRLNRLGLFLGTNNGFELDKPCNRFQGPVMFIRLVGEEKIAISEPKASPFEDVTQAWAMPYIGQMYVQGYSTELVRPLMVLAQCQRISFPPIY